MCPGPRLATIDAWIEYLIGQIDIIDEPLTLTDDVGDGDENAASLQLDQDQDLLVDDRERRTIREKQSVAKVRGVCLSIFIITISINNSYSPHYAVGPSYSNSF